MQHVLCMGLCGAHATTGGRLSDLCVALLSETASAIRQALRCLQCLMSSDCMHAQISVLRVAGLPISPLVGSCLLATPPQLPLRAVHGWAIALNCWGRHLENRWNNCELFYVLERDCPSSVQFATDTCERRVDHSMDRSKGTWSTAASPGTSKASYVP